MANTFHMAYMTTKNKISLVTDIPQIGKRLHLSDNLFIVKNDGRPPVLLVEFCQATAPLNKET